RAIPCDHRILPAADRLHPSIGNGEYGGNGITPVASVPPLPRKPRITLWYYRQPMPESMKERLIKKFQEEIQALNYELKLELPKEIKRAREHGDLRENAEYAAAKERQGLVESRISMLQKRVSEIALLNVDRIPRDRAGFGSTVHVVEDNGDKLVFQLVMPE